MVGEGQTGGEVAYAVGIVLKACRDRQRGAAGRNHIWFKEA